MCASQPIQEGKISESQISISISDHSINLIIPTKTTKSLLQGSLGLTRSKTARECTNQCPTTPYQLDRVNKIRFKSSQFSVIKLTKDLQLLA